jgi:hypothetical protein
MSKQLTTVMISKNLIFCILLLISNKLDIINYSCRLYCQTPQWIVYKIESAGSISGKNMLEDMWCLIFSLTGIKSHFFLELD